MVLEQTAVSALDSAPPPCKKKSTTKSPSVRHSPSLKDIQILLLRRPLPNTPPRNQTQCTPLFLLLRNLPFPSEWVRQPPQPGNTVSERLCSKRWGIHKVVVSVLKARAC